MSESNYMNDDCWIGIIKLQQNYNNYLMTMQNDLTESFPFTGQTESDELNRCFQQIYAIIKKRRDRHEALLDMASAKVAKNERLTHEPGTTAQIVPVPGGAS